MNKLTDKNFNYTRYFLYIIGVLKYIYIINKIKV